MKSSLTLASLALAALVLASQARADEAKPFEVAAASRAERTAPAPAATSDSRSDLQATPIVIEILGVAYLPDSEAPVGAPATASAQR